MFGTNLTFVSSSELINVHFMYEELPNVLFLLQKMK